MQELLPHTKPICAGISALSYYLPGEVVTSNDIENRINDGSSLRIREGLIDRVTKVSKRYFAATDQYNSTLAIEACKNLFVENVIHPQEIDLLIFAATGQDILEPATAHIVQDSIGTQCPVLDVTNACNSFMNALEIAQAFVMTKKYHSILIATGEVPSKSIRYELEDNEELRQSFPGYVFGDAGTAVLIDRNATIATIDAMHFFADSSTWDVAMYPGGGSRFQNIIDANFFSGDGAKLVEPFFAHAEHVLGDFLKKTMITLDEIDHFFVHQITGPYLSKLCTGLGIPLHKVQVTIHDYGNVAAASIPLALCHKMMTDPPLPGSRGLCIGLAGGMSIGLALLTF